MRLNNPGTYLAIAALIIVLLGVWSYIVAHRPISREDLIGRYLPINYLAKENGFVILQADGTLGECFGITPGYPTRCFRGKWSVKQAGGQTVVTFVERGVEGIGIFLGERQLLTGRLLLRDPNTTGRWFGHT